MPSKPVVVNNSPLSGLWAIGQLTLLRDLYDSILIPNAVFAEFVATETVSRTQYVAEADWIEVVAVQNKGHVLSFANLDRGEAEVLALAAERSAQLVIIDERKGRQYAEVLGLPLTGTLGVLVSAKHEGLIKTVRPHLQALQIDGLYLSSALIQKVLTAANE